MPFSKPLQSNKAKERLIPVLANTEERMLSTWSMKEFEMGNADMRDVCFKTLTSWNDYTASSALYEIVASKNKTFEDPAFRGYIRQGRPAPVTDEQKLLLYRKILPFALSADRKNEILTQLGRLKTYQALFLTGTFLDDPKLPLQLLQLPCILPSRQPSQENVCMEIWPGRY
jgi:hypothetical protein